MIWLKNKGAILIIIWSYLVSSVFFLLRAGYKKRKEEGCAQFTGIMLVGSTLLYPVGGWLADTRIGRYKVILYSMWIMWIGTMLATFNEVLAHATAVYETHSNIKKIAYGVLCVVMATGLGGFQSNIVQFGIDQLPYASAIEITSFIRWYTLTLFASGLTLHYVSDCIVEEYNMLLLVVAICLTLALCSVYLFHQWLVKEHTTENVICLILKVVQHTTVNRKFRYDFATRKNFPSEFDVAKHIHGGGFTTQQVDNVCTFLWMLVVIVACGLLASIWKIVGE